MLSCPANAVLEQDITLTLQCFDASDLAVDADDLPTYSVYENTTDTAIATGSFAKVDDAGTTGFYGVTIDTTEDNGFDLWKTYTVRAVAAIATVSKVYLASFSIISSAGAFAEATGLYSVAETEICNMALGGIGAKRITDIETDTTPEAQQCRLHYTLSRRSLLRSFWWPFARARAVLSESTDTPAFEWDHQFVLPNDYLRLKGFYPDQSDHDMDDRFSIEGRLLLTNDDTVQIKYVRDVTDPSEFDPLFLKLFVATLKLEFLYPLTGTNTGRMKAELTEEVKHLRYMAKAVALDEVNISGRDDWNLERFS